MQEGSDNQINILGSRGQLLLIQEAMAIVLVRKHWDLEWSFRM